MFTPFDSEILQGVEKNNERIRHMVEIGVQRDSSQSNTKTKFESGVGKQSQDKSEYNHLILYQQQ